MALERLLANYQDGRRQPRGLWGERRYQSPVDRAAGRAKSCSYGGVPQTGRRTRSNEGSSQPVDATKPVDNGIESPGGGVVVPPERHMKVMPEAGWRTGPSGEEVPAPRRCLNQTPRPFIHSMWARLKAGSVCPAAAIPRTS